MRRARSMLVIALAVAFAAVAAPACDAGGGGESLGPTALPAAACGLPTRCEGDITGSWRVVGLCPGTSSASVTVPAGAVPECPDYEQVAGLLGAAGFITLDDEGGYVAETVSVFEYEFVFPRVCVPLGCDDLSGAGLVCEPHSAGCRCTLPVELTLAQHGTYERTGGEVRIDVGDATPPVSLPACVSGDQLRLERRGPDGSTVIVALERGTTDNPDSGVELLAVHAMPRSGVLTFRADGPHPWAAESGFAEFDAPARISVGTTLLSVTDADGKPIGGLVGPRSGRAGLRWTLLAWEAPDGPRVSFFEDVYARPSGPFSVLETARLPDELVFVNASPFSEVSVGAVDVAVVAIAQGLAPGASSAPAPPREATEDLLVDVDGDGVGDAAFRVPGLADGGFRRVFVVSEAGRPTLLVDDGVALSRIAADDDTAPKLRLVNRARGVGAVALHVAGVPLGGPVDEDADSGRLAVRSGRLAVEVVDADGVAVGAATVVAPLRRSSILILEGSHDAGLSLTVRQADPGDTGLRVTHAAPGRGAIGVSVLRAGQVENTVVEELAHGQHTPWFEPTWLSGRTVELSEDGLRLTATVYRFPALADVPATDALIASTGSGGLELHLVPHADEPVDKVRAEVAAPATLRMVHLVSGLAEITVELAGAVSTETTAVGHLEGGVTLGVSAEAKQVVVRSAMSGQVLATHSLEPVGSGSTASLVVFGEPGDVSVALIPYDTASLDIYAELRVRVFNAAYQQDPLAVGFGVAATRWSEGLIGYGELAPPLDEPSMSAAEHARLDLDGDGGADLGYGPMSASPAVRTQLNVYVMRDGVALRLVYQLADGQLIGPPPEPLPRVGAWITNVVHGAPTLQLRAARLAGAPVLAAVGPDEATWVEWGLDHGFVEIYDPASQSAYAVDYTPQAWHAGDRLVLLVTGAATAPTLRLLDDFTPGGSGRTWRLTSALPDRAPTLFQLDRETQYFDRLSSALSSSDVDWAHPDPAAMVVLGVGFGSGSTIQPNLPSLTFTVAGDAFGPSTDVFAFDRQDGAVALGVIDHDAGFTPVDGRPVARLGFVNAIPGLGPVSVEVDADHVLSAGSLMVPTYTVVDAGPRAITLPSQGLSTTASLTEAGRYTVILSGTAEAPSVAVMDDSGQFVTGARVVHNVPSWGEIAVWHNPPSDPNAILGSPLGTLAPGQVSEAFDAWSHSTYGVDFDADGVLDVFTPSIVLYGEGVTYICFVPATGGPQAVALDPAGGLQVVPFSE